MKVGLITHAGGLSGGIEWVVENEARRLRASGHEVVLHQAPDLGSGGLRRLAAAALLAVRPVGRLRRSDVLLAHYPPSPWIARRARRPFVYYMHHPLRAVEPTSVRRRRLRFRVLAKALWPLGRLERRSVLDADGLLTVSPTVAAEIGRIYGRAPMVVPPGVDVDFFTPGGARGDHLLFVGRTDEPYKHLDWALDVARRIDRPLRVVGPGDRRLPPGSGALVWLGPLDPSRLREEYRRAGLLLFPSEGEDFGMVPLEAMACGLAVVAWDDGHGPSWTMAPFADRCLANPYDLDGFTALARELLDDPPDAAVLRERVVTRFSWDAHHAAIDQSLRALVG
jgi:glycosyltransferase involved in cell wall biosynthesis